MIRSGKMAFLSVLSLFVFVVSVPAARAEDASVKPRSVHESCFPAEAGSRIAYAYRSSWPVAFNIHYHVGEDVLYLARAEAAREGSGAVAAPLPDTYCLMWENRNWRDAALSFDVTVDGEPGPVPPGETP